MSHEYPTQSWRAREYARRMSPDDLRRALLDAISRRPKPLLAVRWSDERQETAA
jgi:hypothetical protein